MNNIDNLDKHLPLEIAINPQWLHQKALAIAQSIPYLQGMGIDVVEIARIQKAQTRNPTFAKKILTPAEYTLWQHKYECTNSQPAIAFLAKRFAAKEAIAKAIGLGMRHPMYWQAVSILPNALGKPMVQMNDELSDYLQANMPRYFLDVSISDEKRYALAFAIITQNI